jgi:hypothetical protein
MILPHNRSWPLHAFRGCTVGGALLPYLESILEDFALDERNNLVFAHVPPLSQTANLFIDKALETIL